MESSVGPSGVVVEKEKGKKIWKSPHGKEDKDQMKYQFQEEPLKTKVTSTWKEVTDTNIGHIDINEFKQRVWINPKIENAWIIRGSGIFKVAGFPPTPVSPKLLMACREAYQEETRTIVDRDKNILADMSAKAITNIFHIPTFKEMEVPTTMIEMQRVMTTP